MLWIIADPITPYVWILSELVLVYTYCAMLSKYLAKVVLIAFPDDHDHIVERTRAFIYNCGVHHFIMVCFMAWLYDEKSAYYILVAVSISTAYVSLRLALFLRKEFETKSGQ